MSVIIVNFELKKLVHEYHIYLQLPSLGGQFVPSRPLDRVKKTHLRDRSVLKIFLGGGTSHMKGVGMLVVSLRGVNFGFWSHLGCSGQNAIIFSREGLV